MSDYSKRNPRDWPPMELIKNASLADDTGHEYTAAAFHAFAELLTGLNATREQQHAGKTLTVGQLHAALGQAMAQVRNARDMPVLVQRVRDGVTSGEPVVQATLPANTFEQCFWLIVGPEET